MWLRILVSSPKSTLAIEMLTECCPSQATPDVLGPEGNVDVEQLFHSERVGLLVAHHRDVVQPVKVRESLPKIGHILKRIKSQRISTCRYVLYSISFSVPLCRRPMWGSALVTVSPSSCSTSLCFNPIKCWYQIGV